MIGRSHGDGSTVPSLSHADAEGLISARLDMPLDPRQEQMLAVHLRSCHPCTQFANQMDAMRTGFRAIPHLPASPTVSRQVRERIAQPRSIWARMGGFFGGQLGGAPMAASAALIALVVVTYAIFESNSDDGNKNPVITAGSQITATASVSDNAYLQSTETQVGEPTSTVSPGKVITPSEVATSILEIRAATDEPTEASSLADEPTSTEAVDPTATNVDPTATDVPTEEPTATDEPTEEPSETATSEPTVEPTETVRPTREPTETQEATATEEPTDEPTATEEPTRAPTSTKTPTEEPTATERPTREPTETEEPTEEPTATEEPTEEPTATDVPTETGPPTIESITGQNDEFTTEPVEEDTVEADPTEEVVEVETPAIEPIDADPTDESGNPDDVGGPADDPTEENGPEDNDRAPLDNSGRITGLPSSGGAPVGPLRINSPQTLMVVSGDSGGSSLQVVSAGDGTVYAELGSGANPIWSPLGIVLLYQDFSGGSPAAATYDSETGERDAHLES